MTTNIESVWVLALASKCNSIYPVLLAAAAAWFLLSLIHWAQSGGPAWGKLSKRKPIPGPRGFPIIGSISLMSGLAHRKLHAAALAIPGAKRLMAFSIGETRAIVTCNPDVAKEILTSPVFVDRPIKESAYRLMFNRAIGFAPYGVYWTTLRRISAAHLFCPKQIKASESGRTEIANQMVSLFQSKDVVRVRDALKRSSLNSMMSSVFGRNYRLDSNEAEIEELKELVDEGYELLGTLNWSDHLPWLLNSDFQRIQFRCSNIVPKVNRFVGRIIDEHRAQTDRSNKDFVDVLLSLQGDDKLADSDMIAVLWEMIFRGTDTVAVMIEWVLARMVLHPEVQSLVHEEIDRVVGRARGVTESDVSELVYLTAVIKEVLRMHPPGPLLSWARLSVTDTQVDGYDVPAGTTAMVNMWAITRDPQVWSDPLRFDPTRFLAKDESATEFSIFGSDLRMAPFGAGRRSCPGKALGWTTAAFWVASLLKELEFKECDPHLVDLSEVLRLSSEMANPLMVKVQPRMKPNSIISQ